MKRACTETPLSWLLLEQLHLGELEARAAAKARAHLAACAACSEELAAIAEDDARPLPALPTTATSPPRPPALRRAAPFVFGALAAAAAFVLFVRRPSPMGDAVPAARVKGGEVALTLVRDDDTTVAEAGGSYRDGDRFKAAVSCPPRLTATWDLVVYERGEASFPLSPTSTLACGNGVPLPGAFRVTGRERLVVCVVWRDGPIDRDELRRTPPELLAQAACEVLEAAPP